MNTTTTTTGPAESARARLDQDLKGLRGAIAALSPDQAGRRFLEIASILEREDAALGRRLLEVELDWNEEDRQLASWLRTAHGDLASLAYLLHRAFVAEDPAGDAAHQLAARVLLHSGEAVKAGTGLARGPALDFSRMHSLMRWAIANGHARTALSLPHGGREMPCTLESLYWRTLLLARFAGGALRRKQIEVLDAWLWIWMPVLAYGRDATTTFPLRADLDGNDGLQRGVRLDEGPTLYLAQGPLDAAYASLLAEFHAGRMVPSDGIASRFRIEDHVKVLDLLRREWRASRRAPAVRAERHPSGRPAELLAGIPEVMRRGFTAAAPAAPALTLAERDSPSVTDRGRARSVDSIYEPDRRHVRVLDESETGWGFEGALQDCGSIAVGDLVALRIPGMEGPAVGRVVRTAASKFAGRVVLGVRKVADRVQQVEMQRTADSVRVPMLFVRGSDRSGRHDSFLVPERSYDRTQSFDALLDGVTYSLRFNRVRERGRGWILAGFEVLKAQASPAFAHSALGKDLTGKSRCLAA